MECKLAFTLTDSGGVELAAGKATAALGEKGLSLSPEGGRPMIVSCREISGISSGDFRVDLALGSGESLRLFHLGRAYEGFTRELRELYNRQLISDLLMDERLLEDGYRGKLTCHGIEGSPGGGTDCELRLYETSVVVITGSADPMRILLSDIDRVKVEDYSLVLGLEDGAGMSFSMMGKKLDHAFRSVSRAIEELSLRVQSALEELAPAADASTVRRAAELMREGRAVSRSEVEELSPELWSMLEKKVAEAGIGEEYRVLSGMARPGKTRIGVKRGLMGDLTGDYVWFLVPIYGEDPDAPGNAIAMEAVSETGKGKATYFFRIIGRDEYCLPGSLEAADGKIDELTRTVNRCLQAINFRREPIYLPEEKLTARYAVSVRKIPELRKLRELFIGRVVHSSFEQWERDVRDLLLRNVQVTDGS